MMKFDSDRDTTTRSGDDPTGDSRAACELLSTSRIYRDYEQAFQALSGLPLALRPPDVDEPVLHGNVNESPFCKLMAKHHRACAECLAIQAEAVGENGEEHPARTLTCFAGLCETAIPVQGGGEALAFLRTGQIGIGKPTPRRFARIAHQLIDWGFQIDLKQAEEAYFHTRFLSRKKYAALVRLLTVFSQHLNLISNELMIRPRPEEPAMIGRAKLFIEEHHQENLSLRDVAGLVNASTFYFCRKFKKATGISFTSYLSRVRVEKAKNLLLNPHARVGEVGFHVGFQSLSHFTRVFRRYVGCSPAEYQKRCPLGAG